jgi:FkbM family methyltransferase
MTKEVFILVGTIASGKSYIGRLIENYFDIPFFEYEDIFIEQQKAHPDNFLGRAEPLAEKAIFNFLEKKRRICFENTMNRPYALDILRKLQQISDVRIIYVDAPVDLARRRLEQRPKSTHVKWTKEELDKIYVDSKRIDLGYDIVLDNANLSDEELRRSLQGLMSERVWYNDHVEINFRGQKLKFDSWSGDNLTPYDMEYKPWRASFHKENLGYLKHCDLSPGDVVIDAGGYEGTFSIYAAKAVGATGTVVVFEPDTGNCRKLESNVRLNGLQNVIIINKALWSEDKTLKFNNKHTAGASFFFNASPHIAEVSAVSLDNELGRLGISGVNFIKTDIEGSEIRAIEGAKQVLTDNNVHLVVASYHIVNGEETSTEVENILKRFGYEAMTEFPQHKTTYGFKK